MVFIFIVVWADPGILKGVGPSAICFKSGGGGGGWICPVACEAAVHFPPPLLVWRGYPFITLLGHT